MVELNFKNGCLLLVMGVVVSGCSMTRASDRPPAPMTVMQPKPPEYYSPKKGSIWLTTNRNTLFLDNKARHIGDIITVTISESSTAEKSAETTLSRESESEIKLGTLFGLTAGLQGKGNKFFDGSSKIEGTNDHTGSGTTSRSGEFTATVSCQVVEVLPNGNLRIEGRRDITVNHENQFIIMSGIIRPEDIDHKNTVRSAQIADARIDFSGEGDIDAQQRPSLIHRFFQAIPII